MNTRKYFKYPIVFGTAALCVFFFAAPANKQSDQPVPPDFTGLSGAISQVRELHAAENAWGFVRQSATWANSNSLIIDSIISSLQSSGILNQSAGTYNFANQNVSGTQYHMQIGVGTNDTVNGAGYSGTKTYTNRFLMWRASDDAKALELFFDNSTDTSGDGALMTYSLNVLNGSRFTATAPLVETYVFGSAGSRKQVYSWRDGPLVSGTVPGSLNGRVLLEE
ncbi:MAG: hypothetical protein KDK27_19145, partial [Leptospiraceae bacterium]|nr:hypothetical protein [Leptospiraceae bacterium]